MTPLSATEGRRIKEENEVFVQGKESSSEKKWLRFSNLFQLKCKTSYDREDDEEEAGDGNHRWKRSVKKYQKKEEARAIFFSRTDSCSGSWQTSGDRHQETFTAETKQVIDSREQRAVRVTTFIYESHNTEWLMMLCLWRKHNCFWPWTKIMRREQQRVSYLRETKMRQERNLRHQIKLSEGYAWEEKTRET